MDSHYNISVRILFVCTGNTCRSPLAERLARHAYPEHKWESAGVMPQGGIHPMSAAVLKERGADAENFFGRFVADLNLADYDHIVLIGDAAQRLVHAPSGPIAHNWDVSDPYEATGTRDEVLEVYRKCALDIERRIADLIAGLKPDTDHT